MPRWTWKPYAELSLDELYDLLALRQEVFVVEQDCPYQDADFQDHHAFHLLGYDDEGLVAYLRAFAPGVQRPEAVIGRVITAPRTRGTGLGRPLMREGERQVRGLFPTATIHLSAQAHLERFYGSLGYAVTGPGYLEDGIPHLPMDQVAG